MVSTLLWVSCTAGSTPSCIIISARFGWTTTQTSAPPVSGNNAARKGFYYAKVKLMVYVRVVQVSGFDGNGIFQQKSEYTKVSYRYLKNFEQKKCRKNSTNQRAGKLICACSTEFKTVLGLKIVYVVLEKF